MKTYKLMFWDCNEDDETTTVMHEMDVLVSPETITQALSNNNQKFLRFTINDGEDLIIQSEYIHSLTEKFG